MATPEKCKHEVCVCTVTPGGEFGGYCSSHCQSAKDLTELRCHCGHDACRAGGARRPADDSATRDM